RQARLRARRGPELSDTLLDGGIAAGEALLAQRLEDALRGDVGILPEELGDAHLIRIDLGDARRPLRGRPERLVLRLSRRGVRGDEDPDGVAADAERTRDGSTREALSVKRHELENQLLTGAPDGRHAASFSGEAVLRSQAWVMVRWRASSTGTRATR